MSQLSDRYNDENEDAVAVRMRAHAITTVRYKVYIFILIVFLVFIRPMVTESADKLRGTGSLSDLLKIGQIPNIVTNFLHTRGEGGVLNSIDEVKEKITTTESDIASAKLTADIIASLNEPGKQNTLINCLNNGFCENIQEGLLPLLPFFRTYLLIGNLKGTKMQFNQKVMLKNINDFLLKTNAGLENGSLEAVSFADPQVVNEKYSLYKLPFTLKIAFEHKEMLLSFLHNIEEKVSFTIPVLYKVNSLTYNIVEYNELQTVNIGIDAYYIQNLEMSDDEDKEELPDT